MSKCVRWANTKQTHQLNKTNEQIKNRRTINIDEDKKKIGTLMPATKYKINSWIVYPIWETQTKSTRKIGIQHNSHTVHIEIGKL